MLACGFEVRNPVWALQAPVRLSNESTFAARGGRIRIAENRGGNGRFAWSGVSSVYQFQVSNPPREVTAERYLMPR